MNGTYTTDYGKIVINNGVIAKMAGLKAIGCFGIVGMAALSKRDGIVKLLTRNSLTKGIRVTIEDNEIYIDFHVIVAYGVSIAAIAENLWMLLSIRSRALPGSRSERSISS